MPKLIAQAIALPTPIKFGNNRTGLCAYHFDVIGD